MISKEINKAVEILKKNKLIAIPTETVYGLAGNAFSEIAINKIFELKKRPFFNPLIVHIKSVNVLNTVAKDVPNIAIHLAKTFWPGPLTMVLKKQNHIPERVTAGKDTVAVRVPNHTLTLELLNCLDFPLAAPSANPFGQISPTTSKHVANYFNDELEVILDGGICEKGIESTIIGFENNQVVLYRHGSISVEDIEKITGKLIIKNQSQNAPNAPGMLTSHYAPKTKTYLSSNVSKLIKSFPNKKIGLMLYKNEMDNHPEIIQVILSKSGFLEEAAKNLYAAMHLLDQCDLDLIIAEKLPEKGLGKSINDRLYRATK
jgi:L-threonylcarbamoyladenylate synthase